MRLKHSFRLYVLGAVRDAWLNMYIFDISPWEIALLRNWTGQTVEFMMVSHVLVLIKVSGA